MVESCWLRAKKVHDAPKWRIQIQPDAPITDAVSRRIYIGRFFQPGKRTLSMKQTQLFEHLNRDISNIGNNSRFFQWIRRISRHNRRFFWSLTLSLSLSFVRLLPDIFLSATENFTTEPDLLSGKCCRKWSGSMTHTAKRSRLLLLLSLQESLIGIYEE